MIDPGGRPTRNESCVTDAETFAVTLTLDEGYAFDVDPEIPGALPFRVDETPPLGSGSGPNPLPRPRYRDRLVPRQQPPFLPAEGTRGRHGIPVTVGIQTASA